jgi:uncharacterized membrane protein
MTNKGEGSASQTARLGLVLLLAGWGVWLGAVLLAPLLARWDSALASPLYQFFGSICHQQPERSFTLAGHPLAVCHRCLGLYLGLGLGLLTLPLFPRLAGFIENNPRILLATTLPLLIDVALIGINTPASRFATGVLASFPVALFCWRAAEQIVAARRRFRSEAA